MKNKPKEKIIEILEKYDVSYGDGRPLENDIANQILELFAQEKQKWVEEIERIRQKSHNGKDIYIDLVKLIRKFQTKN